MNDLAFCGFTLSADADDKSRWFSDDLCNQKCKVKHKSQIPFLLQCLTVCNEQTQTNTDSLSLSMSPSHANTSGFQRKTCTLSLSLSLSQAHTFSPTLALTRTQHKEEARGMYGRKGKSS